MSLLSWGAFQRRFHPRCKINWDGCDFMQRPNIVILGAGFGGIITAVRLQKELKRDDANITLVNKHDYHYQTTWLHESSAGTLHHDRVRIPIKELIDENRINFIQ